MPYEHRISFQDTDFPNLAVKLKPILTELSHQRGSMPAKLLILLPKHLAPKMPVASGIKLPVPLKAVRELLVPMKNAIFDLKVAVNDTRKHVEVVVIWS